MKKIFNINKLSIITVIIIMGLVTVSCEDYLDKAPEATITEKDVFGNFVSFQGFVEEMHNCVIDYSKCLVWYNFNFADEVLSAMPMQYDDGDYWNQYNLLYDTNASTDLMPIDKRIWPLCWYGIRKANLGLSKLDLLVDATPEEKNIIKGECLFFRAWFHFELMRFWGGLPYIDTVLSSSEPLTLPRLNYRETALKAAKDFEDAAALLPIKWDETEAGKVTLGNNSQRITKIHALAYLGKDLLYAASPMMNEESTGNASYDSELCKQAAQAFANVIKTCDETGAFKLQSWETWTDNFWVWSPGNSQRPGGTEVILEPTAFIPWFVRWTTCRTVTPPQFGAGGYLVEVPTQNYVKNYGMTSGLPINDPLSGYDPNNPWANRDPRFYKDIIVDGDMIVTSNDAGSDKFAQLYNGGRHRGGSGSVTGYLYKKFVPIGCNPWDNKWDNFQSYTPFMRLADVYLMYAEAVLQGFGSSSSSVTGSITAEKAINIVRNRAKLPDLTSAYTASKDVFMEDIIRERAVELAFEGHRFFDLRRWNVATQTKYLEKSAIDFDRGADGKPINIQERVIAKRVVEKKHNWFPFQTSLTKLYPGFHQNPGW